MDTKTAIKIVQRRLRYLESRIDQCAGSEQALMFDQREKDALEYLIVEVSPAPMVQEVDQEAWVETRE